jgi:hypothetical protein
MRPSRHIFPFVFGLLLAGSAFAQEKLVANVKVTDVQKLRSATIETRVVNTAQGGTVEVKSLKVVPERASFRLALPNKATFGGTSLARFRYDENGLAAFTGGFLDTYSPATPAGLVQYRNNIVSNQASDLVMTAVVCYSSDKINPVAIVPAKEFSPGKTKGDCVQTGPFLAGNGGEEAHFATLDGALKFPFSRDSFQRAFLMVGTGNEIVIGVSSRTSLFALRELLLTSPQNGGFGAKIAVALSGTRTAGFIVEADNKKVIAGTVNTLLPNAAIIAER